MSILHCQNICLVWNVKSLEKEKDIPLQVSERLKNRSSGKKQSPPPNNKIKVCNRRIGQ